MTHILNDYEIEKVKEEMCDDYCAMPCQYSQEMLISICADCPLNRLEEGHDEI